jgi:hypothetical protein
LQAANPNGFTANAHESWSPFGDHPLKLERYREHLDRDVEPREDLGISWYCQPHGRAGRNLHVSSNDCAAMR